MANHLKGKGKVCPLDAMKTHTVSGGVAAFILKLGTGFR